MVGQVLNVSCYSTPIIFFFRWRGEKKITKKIVDAMFSSWSKLQFCYICNEAQWAKKKLINGANFGYKWIHDYLKYYPLAFGVTLWKKDRSQKLTCQLGWNCPFPWNLSPLCQNKLNRASKQHILTTTRTQQPNEPFFVVEKAIRHLWSVIWPDCQQPT